MYYVVVAHSIHLELICDSLLLNVILECYQPLAVLSIWFLNCSSLISGTVPQNAKKKLDQKIHFLMYANTLKYFGLNP